MNELEITSINIKVVKDEAPVMAYCSVVFNNAFAVRKIRILSKNDSFHVFMPSMKTREGKYSDICHPINQPTRDKLEKAILTTYMGQLKSVVG